MRRESGSYGCVTLKTRRLQNHLTVPVLSIENVITSYLVLLTAILPKNVFKSNLRRLCHRCWCGGQLHSPLLGFPRTKNTSIGAGTKCRLIHARIFQHCEEYSASCSDYEMISISILRSVFLQ